MASDQRKITEAYGVQHIDEAYVKSLADPLVRFMDEPPHDPLTVLAVACRAALYMAWELIHLAEIGLRRVDDREERSGKRPDSLPFEMQCHGQLYAGRKVIRDIAETLKLMRPGELADPGERVYAARTGKRMSQAFLADQAHVDRSLLGRIERGERNLTPSVAQALAEVLDATAEYLLTGRDPGEGAGDGAQGAA